MVNKNKLILPLWSVLLISLYLYNCAAEGIPSGGPKDETGPVLQSTYPQEGATEIRRDVTVVFEFSEPVDYKSVENSLTIFPAMENRPKMKIRKNQVKIELTEKLKENTTYIFTFGRKIQDYQKNMTAGETKLAFSTGKYLDQSRIAGRLYDYNGAEKAAYIMFYRNDAESMDSLAFQAPDYFTSVDQYGNYAATNIAPGKYSAIAYVGSFKGQPRLTEKDLTAVAFQNIIHITSTEDTLSGIDFRLGNYPLKPFRYLKTIPEEGRLELTFSHNIQKTNPNINIKLNGKPEIKNCYFTDDKPDVIHLNMANKDSGEYILSISGVYDQFDRAMSAAMDTVLWEAPEVIDTLGATLQQISPARQEAGIDASILVAFNEPVPRISDFSSRINFMDNDSNTIEFSVKNLNLREYEILPAHKLNYATPYHLEILTDSVPDFYGNFCSDSLKKFSFSTVDDDLFGMLSGKIISDQPLEEITVCCIHAEKKDLIYKTQADHKGNFRFDQCLPGDYNLYLYRDKNENGEYDWGSLVPYSAAEPYQYFSRKISVRSRWETERVELKF